MRTLYTHCLILDSILLLMAAMRSYLFIEEHIRWFSRRKTRFFTSELLTTLAVWIAMMNLFFLPLDVFIVSFMKNNQGEFKSWAAPQIEPIFLNFIDVYPTLRIIIYAFVFFLLPLLYFTCVAIITRVRSPFYTSIFHTLCFAFSAVVLFVIGLFIPYRQGLNGKIHNQNNSDVEPWPGLAFQVEIQQPYGYQDGGLFLWNILILLGSCTGLIYTALGLSSFPIETIRGWRKLSLEVEMISERISNVRIIIEKLQLKLRSIKGTLLANNDGQPLAYDNVSLKFMNRLSEGNDVNEYLEKLSLYEHEEDILITLYQDMEASYNPWQNKDLVIKIFNIIFGLLYFLTSWLIWISLLISNLERIIFSKGYKEAYLLKKFEYPNPLDYIMLSCRTNLAFDYVIHFVLITYLVSCTFSGIQYVGFCVWRKFSTNPHCTGAPSMVILAATVMCTVVSMSGLIFQLMPQYATFGSQTYIKYNAATNTSEVVKCNHLAPAGECLMTRATELMFIDAYKNPFFAAAYYWLSWIFLLVVFIGFFLVAIKEGPLTDSSKINEVLSTLKKESEPDLTTGVTIEKK